MRDPYLYDDVDVLKNIANIKDYNKLREAESAISSIAMESIYNTNFDAFNTETLQQIHHLIFGQIYDWAGDFRTIQMIKREDVLGGDTVGYTEPKSIKKELNIISKELKKLKRADNDKDIVFKLVRIIANIWHIPRLEKEIHEVLLY